MKRSTAFLLVGIAVTGCAPSLAEVRNQPPTRTARIANADYQTLAGWVAERLQTGESSYWTMKIGNLSYQTVTRTDEKRALLTGSSSGPTRIPIIDLTFRQDGAGVIVESRSGGIGLSVRLEPVASRGDVRARCGDLADAPLTELRCLAHGHSFLIVD